MRLLRLYLFTILCCFSVSAPVRAEGISVFAAASTAGVVDELARLYKEKTGVDVRPTYAAASTLAKQIEQGAPAQIFLSADWQWMTYLRDRELLAESTVKPLLRNRLALIAPRDGVLAPFVFEKNGPDLLPLLGNDGRLATGDPDHVPVGIYARQALNAAGQWGGLESRLARAESVRAALALVERGEAKLGIVYATDAAASKKVTLLGLIPDSLHDPVIYPVAAVRGQDNPDVLRFLEFLKTSEAGAVFIRAGFSLTD